MTSRLFLTLILCVSASVSFADPQPNERIKAFCIDFNWGPGGPNGFAPPGMFAQASPEEHVKWYKALGANTIQTFCVNCCGYAWFRSDIAPVQPGMKGDFLKEITQLGHANGMKVMGYFCVSSNTYWGEKNPKLSYGTPSQPHIPFTNTYLDYLCASIQDALKKTDIDGFMIDWVWNLSYNKERRETWLDCEKKMFAELMNKPFPGQDKLSLQEETEFHRRATDRCWERIRQAAKSVKPDCIIWLSCNFLENPQVAGSRMFREVDWLMNEHSDPARLQLVRDAIGHHTKIVQCICGWGNKHDAAKVINDPRFSDVGHYGFARPDPDTTFPPTTSDNPFFAGNAKNIETMRRAFNRPGQIDLTTQPATVPELHRPRFTYSEAVGLGHDPKITRRDPSDVIQVGDTFYVWYTKTPHGHSGYDATIWYAASKDGHTWQEKAEALPRGEPGTWDEASVFTPGILVFDNKYYLFYTAIPKHDVLDTTPTAIGIAESDSPDGPWTRIASNPVLVTSKDPNQFDSFRIDDACLIVRNNQCWLYYKGRQQDHSPAETKMGIAIADQPIGPYIRIPANPVIDSGHEVLVWPHRQGVATLIGWAGPQKHTLQYAPDGWNFIRCAKANDPPIAPGGYRPDAFTNTPNAKGFTWGIAMNTKPRPHLIRYDCNLSVAPK